MQFVLAVRRPELLSLLQSWDAKIHLFSLGSQSRDWSSGKENFSWWIPCVQRPDLGGDGYMDTNQKMLHLSALIEFLVLLYPWWPIASDTKFTYSPKHWDPQVSSLRHQPSNVAKSLLQSTIFNLQISHLKDGWEEHGWQIRVTWWTPLSVA